MSKTIYECVIQFESNSSSFEFDNPEQRNHFYDQIINEFSDYIYKNKNQALLEGNPVEVSVDNYYESIGESIADIIPNTWFKGNIYDELMRFAKIEYSKV